jgi:hypothetical protein
MQNLILVFRELMELPLFQRSTFFFCPESNYGQAGDMLKAFLDNSLPPEQLERIFVPKEGRISGDKIGCIKGPQQGISMVTTFADLLRMRHLAVWEHCIFLTNMNYPVKPNQNNHDACRDFLHNNLSNELSSFKNGISITDKRGAQNDAAIAEMMQAHWLGVFFSSKYAQLYTQEDFYHDHAVVRKNGHESFKPFSVSMAHTYLPRTRTLESERFVKRSRLHV